MSELPATKRKSSQGAAVLTRILPIRACHSFGTISWTDVPEELTATVNGISVPVTRPGWAYSMAVAAQCAAPSIERYRRRRPERTLWYRIVQTHRPLYIGKPTFAIEASLYLVGTVLIDCFGS